MLTGLSAAGAQSDEMIPLTIDTDGHMVDIPFDLDKPAAVSIQAFFPPAELGAIKFAVTDAAGEVVNIAPPRILAPGSYSVAISASGVSSEPFSVKIGVSEPLDPYEPNDTRETASRIELPLRTVIKVDPGKNLDWFKFTIDQAYVLSVHLRARGGASITFKVVDAEGKILYQTASQWDSAGARYASLTTGEYYLAIGPATSSVQVEMELSLYDPDGIGGEKGGFIAVGMKEGSPGLKQLMLIANTTGKSLVETVSPEIMKVELLEAVKEKPVETVTKGSGAWITWLVILLILVVSGGAGF